MTDPPAAPAAPAAVEVPGVLGARWYKDAVVYEVHVRAFNDGNQDGTGDFRGLVNRLDYIQELGVTALWLLPFYPSPLRDDGYDISDYRSIHPAYGTLRDFRRFLREAHRRGLRVITELVLAHTSDEHPWFARARRAAPGTAHRDYYVWSETPDRFADARVIFEDFERSNWTWDPVAGAYFWHRFYAHQPALNYDSPQVRREIFDVVDHWLGMGVDGLRLDAVPYLYAREGTSCENLPETLSFLRSLRAHVDERFADRMLLAEANQWPEDAVAYMGDGDVCHMAFHFPLMPRMFMAARQEDRFPIVDVLSEMPPIPETCQWALFLRNHDELTLEMVTDEERDYMYRAYAQDPRARVNVGIRRRLAPLLGNDRSLIELMNGLLCSLPGTPIIYYGDEIGMGDNIYLGDRDAVRTPMQWRDDQNAGFSVANPQRLYLPVVTDPGYHASAVNVEAQEENASSLLWWTRRLLAVRGKHPAFSQGSVELLYPKNRKVLAFLRGDDEEQVLVVANLSRHAQAVELDLSDFRGTVPVELFGSVEFPVVGDGPYQVTLGPRGFYWLSLPVQGPSRPSPWSRLVVHGRWDQVLSGRALMELEDVLPGWLARRLAAEDAVPVRSVELFEAVPVDVGAPNGAPAGGADGAHHPGTPAPAADLEGDGPARSGDDGYRSQPALAHLVLAGLELADGTTAICPLGLAFASGPWADELSRAHPEAVICNLRVEPSSRPQGRGRPGGVAERGGIDGVLFDAEQDPRFVAALGDAIKRRRRLRGHAGRLTGVPAPGLRRLARGEREGTPATPGSIAGPAGTLAVTMLRRVERGPNPTVEVRRFLTERARVDHVPAVAGSLEYRPDGAGSGPVCVAVLEQVVPNEGDGWSHVVDGLARSLEEVLAAASAGAERPSTSPGLLEPVVAVAAGNGLDSLPETAQLLVGPHLGWATLLGRRTAELHVALSGPAGDPAFKPEPLTASDRQAMSREARTGARRAFRHLASLAARSPAVAHLLDDREVLLARLDDFASRPVRAMRIRCHGDFHLGQVLWTGKDFVVVGLGEGPSPSFEQRRAKRPALADVAGMIRSFSRASYAAGSQVRVSRPSVGGPDDLEAWLASWYRAVARAFLGSYEQVAAGSVFLPRAPEERASLLGFLLLDQAVHELGRQAAAGSEHAEVAAQAVVDLLDEGA